MAEILAQVSEHLRKEDSLVLARIVGGKGSTPREAGARIIIFRDGRTEGTIGGGLVEATAMREASRIFEEKRSILSGITMTSEDAAGADMICGGRLEFLCEYIEATDDAIRVFDVVGEDQRLFRKSVLCTEFLSQGKRLLTVNRFLLRSGIHEESPVPEALLDLLREAAGKVAGSAVVDIGGRRFCIDVVESREAVYIFGAGHVARETAFLASRLDFRVVVLDDREEFASPQRFPPAVETMVINSFAGSFEPLPIDGNSYVVIVTRGHAHDKTVLEQALRTRAAYIGMIGSTRKKETIYKALLSEGFTKEDLKRVHCPIGLPMETETPEEIAVSIVGELIHTRALRRRRSR